MATYLETFLNHIDLIKYKELLHGQGYKEEIDIFLLNEMDLNNVHIMDPTDRNTILNAGSYSLTAGLPQIVNAVSNCLRLY